MGHLHLVRPSESKVLKEAIIVLPLCLIDKLISLSLLTELLFCKLALGLIFSNNCSYFISICSRGSFIGGFRFLGARNLVESNFKVS